MPVISTSSESSWPAWLRWLDNHILLILASVLIVFIPLWPKIPIFSPIEQYIVRVRAEDFLIFFTGLVWVVQWLRGKIKWKTPLTWLVIGYAVVGALSVLSAIFITHTVPLEPLHVGKTLLHYFRYLEYFFLFFVLFSAVQTKAHVKLVLGLLVTSILAISIYGYGQRYWYWPVYSTMNREFSKGVRLYLTEHARVQSTFAGHYDLAAYLVVTLPIVAALALTAQRKWLKITLHLIHIAGVWLIVVSASRTSYVAYILSVMGVIAFLALRRTTWKGRIWWGVSRGTAMAVMLSLMMFIYGDAMYERFLQVLGGYPKLHDTYHHWNGVRKLYTDHYIPALIGLGEWPQAQKPDNAISTDQLAQGILNSDTLPTPLQPPDVYVNVPEIVPVATQSASGAATIIYEERDRVFSECAQKRGLSLCIRLETLWPRAIAGFWKNPLLGSGYATLNKESVQQFTEAESTDNNFLRTLGETGALGFLTFYGCVALVIFYSARHAFSPDATKAAFSVGLLAGSVGLLLNAVYIDVFAASKVALTYWGLAGLLLAYIYIDAYPRPSSSTTVQATSPHNTSDLAQRLAQLNATSSSVVPSPAPQRQAKKSGTKRQSRSKTRKRR